MARPPAVPKMATPLFTWTTVISGVTSATCVTMGRGLIPTLGVDGGPAFTA